MAIKKSNFIHYLHILFRDRKLLIIICDIFFNIYIYRVVQKSLWFDLEEKCFGNSKMFFFYGVFLSIYSHLFKKLEKKSYGAFKILKMACLR